MKRQYTLTDKARRWWHNSRDSDLSSVTVYGIWKVYGEDPNPDIGGHHHQPLLGIFEGVLVDVINYAVELPNFFTWGAGGRIVRRVEDKIIKIDEYSLTARADRLKKIAELEKQLEDLRKGL